MIVKTVLRLCGLGLLVLPLLFGCGGGALDREPGEGTVTFDGQPVPRGSIWFEPDASIGVDAPTGFAAIRDGRFVTEPEESPVAGPHLARISGFDGSPPDDDEWDSPMEYPGNPIFDEYTVDVVIPPPDGPLQIDVPAP